MKARRYQRRTKARDDVFFETYAKANNVSLSAQAAGYSRRSIYDYLHDVKFKERFDDAEHSFKDALRAKIFNRMLYGDEEPIYQNGKLMRKTRIKFPDGIIKQFAKNAYPDEFGDRDEKGDTVVPELNIILNTDDA